MKTLAIVAALILIGVAALWYGCSKKEEAPPQAIAPVVVSPQPSAKAEAKADVASAQAPATIPAPPKAAPVPKAADALRRPAAKSKTSVRPVAAKKSGVGMPMMKGLKSPAELATLVEASLKRDPKGSVQLDPARCNRDGSCATARDYFDGIRTAHPSAKLGDIAELPRYLRSLVAKPAPQGTRWHMSRLLVSGTSHTYDAIGWTRAPLAGEQFWYDVNTGEPILAGDCGNVVGAKVITVAQAPVSPQPQVVRKAFVTGACPNGYFLIVHAWSRRLMPDDLREEVDWLTAEARKKVVSVAKPLTAFQGPDVSRTLGYPLRTSGMPHADVDGDWVEVNLLDPETADVIFEEGKVTLKHGVGTLRFSHDPRAFSIEVVWPAYFVWPLMSNGEARARSLPKEWGAVCGNNTHGVVP